MHLYTITFVRGKVSIAVQNVQFNSMISPLSINDYLLIWPGKKLFPVPIEDFQQQEVKRRHLQDITLFC